MDQSDELRSFRSQVILRNTAKNSKGSLIYRLPFFGDDFACPSYPTSLLGISGRVTRITLLSYVIYNQYL
jgi:hypothetical protein